MNKVFSWRSPKPRLLFIKEGKDENLPKRRIVDKADAKVSVFDHGLLYGDGVFEGIRIYDNCVFKLDEHLERLEFSAKAILLDLPMSRAEFAEAVCETCRRNDLSDGYVRLVVTRGPGHLGLTPDGCGPPNVIIIADDIQLYPEELYENGLKIISVPTRRINASALPPAVKSLNYLNNILAKIEAKKVGFLEALMLNDKGEIAECRGIIIHREQGYGFHSSFGCGFASRNHPRGGHGLGGGNRLRGEGTGLDPLYGRGGMLPYRHGSGSDSLRGSGSSNHRRRETGGGDQEFDFQVSGKGAGGWKETLNFVILLSFFDLARHLRCLSVKYPLIYLF